jgi:predicted secreted protein
MASRPVLTTLLCAVVLAACSATDAVQPTEPAGASCDQFAASRTVEQTRSVDTGADLSVVLCSNPSTGFSWGEPQITDTSVIRLGERAFHESGATALPIVGAAGAEVLTVHAVAAGTTTLTIAYGQPWAGGIQDEWTYRLTVTVR